MGFGNSAQKEANRIAQQQVDLQKQQLQDAENQKKKLEIQADAEAKRQAESRLNTTIVKNNSTTVGGIGRMIR